MSMSENIAFVVSQYPFATAVSDYSLEDCWTYIYDGRDEDGFGCGNVIGVGQFEYDAWANAVEKLKRHEPPLLTPQQQIDAMAELLRKKNRREIERTRRNFPAASTSKNTS